jgi:hypothetical protein
MAWRWQRLPLKGPLHRLCTVVVETHTVQGSPFSSEPKQAGSGVTGLTMPSDGAHFSKSEPKAIPHPSRNSVFIEPRCQAHGIAESTTKQNLLQSQILTLKFCRNALQYG